MKKIVQILLGIILIGVIGYFVFAYVYALSMKGRVYPEAKNIDKLEKQIQLETKSDYTTFFYPIPQLKEHECARLHLRLIIDNDSIIYSKNGVKKYLEQLPIRVNKILTNEQCIDTLLVEYSTRGKRKGAIDTTAILKFSLSKRVN